ncbi:lactoferrin/transferrin family TonB-dependent receptor [Neisseria leonii]|uniref:Lactoferrin/transferrin family TonB-dependent receptor n=1 Tax=Neisseria leonii TaxID=2995413 RepID=A0A9X4E4H6_9NEIS|nr:lactoferrin/transferrin family TonB-dependent receptor [Neisseria sp. 51.81]MDD9328605.1 lactoferrin/transferrin family TonB-dependent receptor [Neisseria sp. 51.81]
MYRHHPNFKVKAVCIALSGLLVQTAWADSPAVPEAGNTVQLQDVVVKGQKRATRRSNEITGLGKIVKTTDAINQEQVLNIRDLTRYDPGISVVEQGRGASSGYSIRGVDRNRISLSVDNLPQIQSYSIQGVNSGSGAINEIEYENVRAIELSKGASSAEYGNGALGGAVGFRTKEVDDLLPDGKDWGLNSKTAYSSKNRQLTQSLGFAARKNGLEAMVQYTRRKGGETQVHKDADKSTRYEITRLGVFAGEYDFLGDANRKHSSWFVLQDECPTLNCAPKPIAAATESHFRYDRTQNGYDPYTPEEQAEAKRLVHPVEKVNAKDYTGPDRVLPNPMDYRTGSWLTKLGYRFSPEHYLGGVFEQTAQNYDIRDMSVPAYYLGADRKNIKTLDGKGIYSGQNLGEGLTFGANPAQDASAGLGWSRSQFFDERHRKSRKGLVYRFTPNGPADSLSLSYDEQQIGLDSRLKTLNCAPYPTVDKNCRAAPDKPWSYTRSEKNRYEEKHRLAQLNFDKTAETGPVRHQFSGLLGADFFQSTLTRSEDVSEYVKQKWTLLDRNVRGQNHAGNGTPDNPYIYQNGGTELIRTNECYGESEGSWNCGQRKITGRSEFIALRDQMKIGRHLELGLGARYDRYRTRSNDEWTAAKSYKNFSWNAGVVVKPTANINLAYRASTGFRVPSFQEMFGFRTPGYSKADAEAYQKQYGKPMFQPTDAEPEKSFNQEIGIGFKGGWGMLEISHFRNRYDGLIAAARKEGNTTNKAYYNVQDVKLTGYNLIGKIDWHGIWNKLPEGLYTTLGYNRVKPDSIRNRPGFTRIDTYLLDTIQPSRYVAGLGYHDPGERWGVNAMMTYSKGKNPGELIGKSTHGGREYNISATGKASRSWQIVDLTGYVNLKKDFTLRAGVYNLFNHRYVTWEALRQSSTGAVHQQRNVGNYARYAAPGRNYTVSLQMKF